MSDASKIHETHPDLAEAVIEQAPDMVIYADREGHIRIWNAAAEKVFGHAAAEVLGRSLDVIIPERFRQAHWEAFNRAVESGVTKRAGRAALTRSMHKNGRKLYVEMSFGLVKDAAGTVIGCVAIGRDCTERRLAAQGAGQA